MNSLFRRKDLSKVITHSITKHLNQKYHVHFHKSIRQTLALELNKTNLIFIKSNLKSEFNKACVYMYVTCKLTFEEEYVSLSLKDFVYVVAHI
jgi:hypothetical protein